jgi:hypothetical protein
MKKKKEIHLSFDSPVDVPVEERNLWAKDWPAAFPFSTAPYRY